MRRPASSTFRYRNADKNKRIVGLICVACVAVFLLWGLTSGSSNAPSAPAGEQSPAKEEITPVYHEQERREVNKEEIKQQEKELHKTHTKKKDRHVEDLLEDQREELGRNLDGRRAREMWSVRAGGAHE